MTEQEKLAREWAEYYQNDWPKFTPGAHAAELVEKAKAAAEYIMEHTTPPTMEGVEWEHDLHHFAGATADTGAGVVMVDPHGPGITVFDLDTEEVVAASPAEITPNGKRYELVETTDGPEPEHPKTLRTVEDYENAPVGTVVAMRRGKPWTKNKTCLWGREYNRALQVENERMSAVSREVLRWGWSK